MPVALCTKLSVLRYSSVESREERERLRYWEYTASRKRPLSASGMRGTRSRLSCSPDSGSPSKKSSERTRLTVLRRTPVAHASRCTGSRNPRYLPFVRSLNKKRWTLRKMMAQAVVSR